VTTNLRNLLPYKYSYAPYGSQSVPWRTLGCASPFAIAVAAANVQTRVKLSYVANCSSVNGLAAFLGEDSDDRVLSGTVKVPRARPA
jgi:hypothetical protein